MGSADDDSCIDCGREIYPGGDRCGRCARNRARAPWLLVGMGVVGAITIAAFGGLFVAMTQSETTVGRGGVKIVGIVGAACMVTIGGLLKAYAEGRPKKRGR